MWISTISNCGYSPNIFIEVQYNIFKIQNPKNICRRLPPPITLSTTKQKITPKILQDWKPLNGLLTPAAFKLWHLVSVNGRIFFCCMRGWSLFFIHKVRLHLEFDLEILLFSGFEIGVMYVYVWLYVLFSVIPKFWKFLQDTLAPIGTLVVTNVKSTLAYFQIIK